MPRKITCYGVKKGRKTGLFNNWNECKEQINGFKGAELIGARRAVELTMANSFKKLILYYDYFGIEKFATGEWTAKKPITIDYQNFMKKYMNFIEIHFVKVKAHSGNKFNDLADKLAKFASKM